MGLKYEKRDDGRGRREYELGIPIFWIVLSIIAIVLAILYFSQ